MQKVIVSDASCLILLKKIGELDILYKVFGDIIITPEVRNEYGLPIPNWIHIKSVENETYRDLLQVNLDIGEASVIALAIELQNCLLIIDDLKGRNTAKKLNIKYTGTLGLIILAKEIGIISSVNDLIGKIKLTNFRLSTELIENALKQAGENK